MKKTKNKVSLKNKLRENAFRMLYWYVNRVDKNSDILLMNYGYHDLDNVLKLDLNDESDRFSIQLYHHLASKVDLKDKDIVEIGCGRGGGLYYITKNFSPASARGVDLDRQAVTFCKCHYENKALNFSRGDAQNLNLENNSCDVLINVESSHRYPDMEAFLAEVSRILRPNGHFLFTDFRHDYEFEAMKKDLDKCGLVMLKEEFINKEVVTALKLDTERKEKLVDQLVPKLLSKFALDFAGAVGSPTYNQMLSREYLYFSYVLQKM
jgi:ubiquinone/menaquinone biosynthesis C-methylase UbiE